MPNGSRRKISAKGLLQTFKAAFRRWSEEKGTRLGAALAYYTAFSIAPLLLLAISIAGMVFGREAAEGQIVGELAGLVGRQSAEMIQSMLQAANRPAAGATAAVIGVVSLLLGASGVMTEMKSALNAIWRVRGATGIKGFVFTKIKAVGMVLALGFLLMVSLALSAGLAAAGKFIGGLLPVPEGALHALNIVVSFGVISLLFAILFKVLPDADIRWRDVWIGSASTAVLFTAGKFVLGLYLGKGAVGSSYGAAGSVLILLAWVYYSAQILYFGAAFTNAYAERYGSGVKPEAAGAKAA